MGRVLRLAGFIALLLPVLARAQLLDFDAVCATPPCAIGSLYAPSGVTFSPNTSQIVAAGTNGLTGTVGGGRYLAIATFPYQITVTLARQATFFSMQLSRASTSSGPVTVSVTWLKAGAPVASQNVVLDNVNSWSPASASAPGGFDSIFIDPSGGANLTFGIDGLQFGGTCNGFSDVQSSDSFCNAAEWLANRGVTLGCAAGQYCPLLDVSRGAMALFMQRLGDAITPQYVQQTGFLDNNTFVGGQHVCQTTPFTVTGYPRTAFVLGNAQIFSASATIRVFTRVSYSTDGGTIWIQIPGFGFSETVEVGGTGAVSDAGVIDLAVGTTYRFALRAVRTAGTAGATASIDCELIAQIGNRRATSSAPFDLRPATGVENR